MRRHWPHAAVGLVAVSAALLWPLTAALPVREAWQARAASAVLAVLACSLFTYWRGLDRRISIVLSVTCATIGVALLITHFAAAGTCVANYDDRPVIIGTSYTEFGQQYVRNNQGISIEDLLLDSAGAPERVWTAESIRTCRLLVSWAGLAAIPLLAISALIPIERYRLPARPRSSGLLHDPPAVSPTSTAPVYDAFISYRHLEPDRSIAIDLVEALEARGLRIALDARDFRPNEHFLSEMERCIKQSRFLLCVVTAEYLQSDHTSEEAIISKTLDLAERRRRLVPLIFERTELPVWLHGLVGIDFTPSAAVDPSERLAQLLTQDRPVPTS